MNAAQRSHEGGDPPKAAIVIDQWELLRLGLEKVLADLDFLVIGSTARSEEAIFLARSSAANIIIVGKSPDLKPYRFLAEINRDNKGQAAPHVVLLLERAVEGDVTRLLAAGAAAVLMRSATATELSDALRAVDADERVIAPALTPVSAQNLEVTGKVAAGLSPKELEVLAELAGGATYEQIAARLVVTKATVKTHLVHSYAKLGVVNRNQAVARAVALGLLG